MTEEFIADLDQLRLAHTYFWNRLTAIEKNHGTDAFCSVCFIAMPIRPGETYCKDCNSLVVDRLQAATLCQQVLDSYAGEIKKALALKKTDGPKAPRADRTDPTLPDLEEQIFVHIPDQPALSFRDAKSARKWLRDHDRSVNQATKDGNHWKF